MHLLSENVAHKVENSFTQRKHPSQRRKACSFEKTSHVKPKTLLPSEDFTRKREKPSTVLIRPSQRLKYVYQAKTCPGKAETFLSRDSDTNKGEKAFPERKRANRLKNRLTSENVAYKGGNAFTELIHS